jgi:hypothetical protein
MTSAIVATALLGAAPVHLAVTLDFTLVRPSGREPKTMQKHWFFEVPAKRADDKSMEELLHRVFFDANVRLRMREPGDTAYLSMVSFKSAKVDTKAVAAWRGGTADAFPWVAAQSAVVWEPGACFVVDDGGHYDTVDAGDYTELLVNRLLESKVMSEADFTAFFTAYYPKASKEEVQALFTERAERMKKVVEIRKGEWPYRKPPGEKPHASGPVDAVVKKLMAAPGTGR